MPTLSPSATAVPSAPGRHARARWIALAVLLLVALAALPVCLADPALLRQVYTNLLNNAFKFTRKRAGARVEVGSRMENGERVWFVKDNGAGFDMRYASKLFGVFQRLHSAEEYEGTGVGLALVQRIVQRHGGRIWAESSPGQGAAFFFTLPEREAALEL